MDYRKINFWQLVLVAFLVNFVGQAVHEAGYWAIFESFGSGPVWGFTRVVQIWGDVPPLHPEEWVEITAPDGTRGWERFSAPPAKTENIIGLMAGPLASLLGVLLGLGLMRFNRNPATQQVGLVLALIVSLLMSLYYLRSFSRASGDEYFLAGVLGIPKSSIDLPFCLAFIAAFGFGVRALGDGRTILKWLGALVLGSVPGGIFLVFADDLILTQVNQGNPLFRPLLGFSLPVVVFNWIIFLALWVWWKRASKMEFISTQTAG
jgi:hypothetical protein